MLPLVRNHFLVLFQLLICAIVLALVASVPPAKGAILIVSLNGQSPGEIARWAIDGRARLVSAGPVPHSLIVSGERTKLGTLALRHRALLLTGTLPGCGEKAA